MELSGVSAELSHAHTEGPPESHQHTQLCQQQGWGTPGVKATRKWKSSCAAQNSRGYNHSTTGRLQRSPGPGEQSLGRYINKLYYGQDSHNSDTEHWGSQTLLLSLHSSFPIGHLDKLCFLKPSYNPCTCVALHGGPIPATASRVSPFSWAAVSLPSLIYPNKLQELKIPLPWDLCNLCTAPTGFAPGLWHQWCPWELGQHSSASAGGAANAARTRSWVLRSRKIPQSRDSDCCREAKRWDRPAAHAAQTSPGVERNRKDR